MFVFKSIQNLQQHLSSISADKSIGFVPTMGALHKGHLSLVNESAKNNKITVVSIFVNPTQFNNPEDLEKYPRTLKHDLALLEDSECDFVFTPTASEIYQENIKSTSFNFDGLDKVMEGQFREGHFDGVGTIVKRFLEIVKPDNAYFGEKDFQQLQIVRKLAEKSNLDVDIVGCEIYRESNGLAMSSRNVLLTDVQRSSASFIYNTLLEAKEKFSSINTDELIKWVENQFKNHSLFELEYFQIADERNLQPITSRENHQICRAFIAVFAGNVRLIDNIRL